MSFLNWCVVILAAGKGKRMKSEIPKVLHEIAGEPMILRVIKSAKSVSENIVVVVGHKADMVKDRLKEESGLRFALQKDQKGTGDAVQSAVPFLGEEVQDVLVLCGDTPLIKSETLHLFIKKHMVSKCAVSVLTMKVEEPAGYGRIILDSNEDILKIVEEADANVMEKSVKLVNTGIYAFNRKFLEASLTKISCNNAQSEYYLTDLIGLASFDQDLKAVHYCLENNIEAVGINSPEQLKKAEALFLENCSVA